MMAETSDSRISNSSEKVLRAIDRNAIETIDLKTDGNSECSFDSSLQETVVKTEKLSVGPKPKISGKSEAKSKSKTKLGSKTKKKIDFRTVPSSIKLEATEEASQLREPDSSRTRVEAGDRTAAPFKEIIKTETVLDSVVAPAQIKVEEEPAPSLRVATPVHTGTDLESAASLRLDRLAAANQDDKPAKTKPKKSVAFAPSE